MHWSLVSMPFDIVSKQTVLMLLFTKYSVRIFFYSSHLFKYVTTCHPTLSLNISDKYISSLVSCRGAILGCLRGGDFYSKIHLRCSPTFQNESSAITSKYLNYLPFSYYDVAVLMWCTLHGDVITDHTPVQGFQNQYLKKAFCSLAF